MKNILYPRVAALLTVLFGFGFAKANVEQELTLKDVDSIRNLINRNVLVRENGEIKLNQTLLESGLIYHLDSYKSTNCGGSCL